VRREGFTVTELIVVVAVAGMILMLALPGFASVLRRSRLNGAVRTLVNDVREARAEATTSGWEYRIVGYGDAASTGPNRYRMLGRRSTAVLWPDEDDEPFTSDTQFAGPWVDIGYLYNGIRLEPQNGGVNPEFTLTFDPRGAAVMTNSAFDPFLVANEHGETVSFRVSVAGGITTQ
jgi:prepilin-type N-terminal cleavage/methylation domain-containing protein